MSYFSDREMCVRGKSDVVWKVVKRGCPQGSICGPAIWNMMIDDLLMKLTNDGCSVIAYADDLLLIVEGKSRKEVEDKGTRWMKMVADWGVGVGLKVSDSKTVMMLMKGKLALNRCPNVRLNDRMIKYVRVTKYLGIMVSERMGFKLHVESLKGKVLNAVGGLRRVLRKEWGLGRKAMRVIYKGLLMSCVIYGACVWYECMNYGYGRTCVSKCERAALYACLRVCRTVSTEAMRMLMDGIPWVSEAIMRACMYKIMKGCDLTEIDSVKVVDVAGKSKKKCRMMLRSIMMNRWQCEWDVSVKDRVTYEWIKDELCG